MSPVYPRWLEILSIGEETTSFKQALPLASNIAIPITNGDSITFNSGTNIIDVRKLSGVPYRRDDIDELIVGNFEPTTSIEYQFTDSDGGLILYSLFQRVWEGSSADFEKIFLPYDYAPDFSEKATDYPVSLSMVSRKITGSVSESHRLSGAVARTFSFSSESGGALNCSVEFGAGSVSYAYDASADTPVFGTDGPLLWQDATVLLALPDTTYPAEQASDEITATAAGTFSVATNLTAEYATGNYVYFRSLEFVSGVSDVLRITESITGTKSVTLDAGCYTAIEACRMVEKKLNKTGFGNTYRVYYDMSTSKIHIDRVSGVETFLVDEDDVLCTADVILGWSGATNSATASTQTADNAVWKNNDIYVIASSTFGAATVVTVTGLDLATPTNAGKVYLYHPINVESFNLTLSNNFVVKHYDNQSPIEFIMGDFTGEGTLTLPWGQYSSDRNYEFNAFISGYNVPAIIYWSSINGEDEFNLGLVFTMRNTNASTTGEDEVLVELPFSIVGGGISSTAGNDNVYTPPIYAVLATNTDEGWGFEGGLRG